MTAEVKTVDEKVLWTAEASSAFAVSYKANFAIDGTGSRFWVNRGEGALHSWLQVQMDQQHWVKGVSFGARPNYSARQKFTEAGSVLLYMFEHIPSLRYNLMNCAK